MDIAAFEEQYVTRVRARLAPRLEQVQVVLPDRSSPPALSGPALAGWWVDEAAAGERVVLPNPYETVEVVAAMESWVWAVVRHLAPALGEQLDAVCGRRAQPVQYWCAVLSPWLVHTVSALADRRLFCRAAAELTPTVPLIVPPSPEPPATTAEAIVRLRTDSGNGGLMALLAPRLGVLTISAGSSPRPGADARAQPAASARPPLRTLIAPAVAMAAGGALTALPRRRVAVVGLTRLGAPDLLTLAARVRGLAVLPRPALRRGDTHAATPSADWQLRSALALPAGDDPLARLAAEALPHLLPRSLLEGFDRIQSESRRRYGRRPLPSLVGNYSIDEIQNEFLGRCRAAGARLAFAQHGGFYLQSPVNAQERLELQPDSVFLSWGGRAPGAVPTPNPHLERLRGSHRGGARITIVEPLEPPDAYVLRFAGHPLANQGYEPRWMLAELVERLSPARRAEVALKRFPNTLGPAARPAVLEALPADGPPGGAAAWMAASRLAVIPYLDTPFIESIVIGTPTVGLWNPARWPLLSELEPLFTRLRALRIIHTDPAAAAEHIDAVYDDVRAWWESEDVVAARAELVERMGIAGDWLEGWSRALRALRG